MYARPSQDWAGTSVTHRGDWTGDGAEDIVARVGGEVRLFPNVGDGRISGHTVLASGLPTTSKIVAVGDATGDGFPDLVAQYADTLYRYDGVPGTPVTVKPPVSLGTGGWDAMTLTAPGDANGDGTADMWATTQEGRLLFLPGGTDATGNPVDLAPGASAVEVGNGGWSVFGSIS